VRRRLLITKFVMSIGIALALVACVCSSTAAADASTVKPTVNKGLCRLVSPSVVATALSASMNYPTTLNQRSTTVCAYRAKRSAGTAVIIRYDLRSSSETFAKTKATFRHRGQKLAPITGLGDEAYYFSETAGEVTVTTIVVHSGSLQLLITGTTTVNPLGSIAQYALSQFASNHPPATTTSST
jgi:hypothetical protein